MGVREAVDRLYEVFARYPRPPWFEACACCWEGEAVSESGWKGTARGVVRVTAPGGDVPLRQVPAAALVTFAENAPLTGGDDDVFKHYLPRLLELAADPGDDFDDPERVVAHLGWVEQWRPDEWEAVVAFLHALWADQPGHDPRWLLAAIAGVDPDVDWYLDHFPPAARSAFLDRESNRLLVKGKLDDGWWDRDRSPARENYERVKEWALAQLHGRP